MKVTYDPHLLGPKGEQIAANYLAENGYRIIKRNYRFHRNEIDIIALPYIFKIASRNPFETSFVTDSKRVF